MFAAKLRITHAQMRRTDTKGLLAMHRRMRSIGAGTRGCEFAISDYVHQPTYKPLELEYTVIGFKSNIV